MLKFKNRDGKLNDIPEWPDDASGQLEHMVGPEEEEDET